MTPLAGLAAVGVAAVLGANRESHGRLANLSIKAAESTVASVEAATDCLDMHQLLTEAERQMRDFLTHIAYSPRKERQGFLMTEFQRVEQRLIRARKKFQTECIK